MRELDDDEVDEMIVAHELADEGEVAKAFEFNNGPNRIIIWFTHLLNGRYECSFGLKNSNPYDYPFSFSPTGTGNEFKVYGAVAQCIREFIAEFSPTAISMVGYDDRQTALYKRAMSRVSLPNGYGVDLKSGGVQIIKVDPSSESN